MASKKSSNLSYKKSSKFRHLILEVISKMGSQNNTHATEMYKAEEVFDVKFVSSHQATEVVQPCEQSLNSPAMPIPAQLSTILSSVPDAITLMWRDHVDALRLKLGIQPI